MGLEPWASGTQVESAFPDKALSPVHELTLINHPAETGAISDIVSEIITGRRESSLFFALFTSSKKDLRGVRMGNWFPKGLSIFIQ